MDLKLFTELLTQLKEKRMMSVTMNPKMHQMGLQGVEAKGNALRAVQQLQQKQEQIAQMQQQMMQQQGGPQGAQG